MASQPDVDDAVISSVSMPDPADVDSREVVLESGGLKVTEATLRRRLSVMAEMAHAHATETVSVAEERDALRRQISEDAQAAEIRVQLEAVTAELDRLRSIPELRVGQRLRHVAKSIGSDDSDSSAAIIEDVSPPRTPANQADPTPESAIGSSAEGLTGLRYPVLAVPAAVVTFRNRGEALVEAASRLKALGIENVALVDNASSDPAMAKAVAVLDYAVTRLDVDLGSDAPWASGVMARLLAIGNVLEIAGLAVPGPGCPDDVVDRMTEELRRRPDIDAVELRQDPDSPLRDTTFRLLRQGMRSRPSLVAQLDDPYVAVAIRSDPLKPSEQYARLHDDVAVSDASVIADG
jgi:hypothetical protein